MRDVRSSPENSESDHLRGPLSLPIRLAVPSAVTASSESVDTTPRIHTPQTLTTDAALYTLTISRQPQPESQLLILSVSKGSEGNDANATRQLIALSVPTEVATQLLFIPGPLDDSPPTPGFSHHLGVDLGPVASNSTALQPLSPVHQLFAYCNSPTMALSFAFAEDNAKDRLLEDSQIGVNLIDIASVFSDREIAVAEKLVDLFACNDTIGLNAAMLRFSEDDFLTAHALFSRFDPPKRDRPDEYSFSPRDVVAARQLCALFASDDLHRPIGPMFLTFLHTDGCVQLMALSDSEDAAYILFELFLPGYPVHARKFFARRNGKAPSGS